MDKDIIACIIAQNGLSTASVLILAKAAGIANKMGTETDVKKKAALNKELVKLTKLGQALKAADTGLTQYINETAGL